MTGALGQQMSTEMAEQPDVLRRLVARRAQIADAVGALDPPSFGGVSLLARGSSDNVAVHARYLVEMVTGRPVGLAAPSLYTLYEAQVDYRGQLIIAVSQSGATPEIVTVLEQLAAAGARTIAVTNDERSALARVADVVIDLQAGAEVAVPATKTVTAQLVGLALIARGLAGRPDRVPFTDDDLDALPATVATVLDDEPAVERAAATVAQALTTVVVARGLLYAAALETALKIRESTGLVAEGWSVADLRHGPIAAVGERAAVIGISAAGPAQPDVDALLDELSARDVPTIRLADTAGADISLPPGTEALAAVPAIVRGQQLALAVARLRGIDPDAPAGLSKITTT